MQPPTDLARRDRRIGYACAIALLFVWAGFLLSSRLGARQAIPAWDLAALRFAGSCLAALPLVAFFGWPRLPWRQGVLVMATAAFGFPLFTFFGVSFAPAAHGAVLLSGVLPFMTAALAWAVLGEAWSRRRVASLAVVACGIGLLAAATFGDHPGAWRGDVLFLCATLSWAIYTTAVRQWGIGPAQGTLAIALWAGPIYLPLWWVFSPTGLADIPFGQALYHFLFQGVFAVLVAGFLFLRAVKSIGAVRTTAITALVPGVSSLAAWPLLGEPLAPLGIVGVGLVTLGMVIAVTQKAAPAAPRVDRMGPRP